MVNFIARLRSQWDLKGFLRSQHRGDWLLIGSSRKDDVWKVPELQFRSHNLRWKKWLQTVPNTTGHRSTGTKPSWLPLRLKFQSSVFLGAVSSTAPCSHYCQFHCSLHVFSPPHTLIYSFLPPSLPFIFPLHSLLKCKHQENGNFIVFV